MTPYRRRAALLLSALVAWPGMQSAFPRSASAQTTRRLPAAATPPGGKARPASKPLPFAPGERLDYDVDFGPLKVGQASMEVAGLDTVRGHPALHTVFTVDGSALLYRVDDRLESWIDPTNFTSLRFRQALREGAQVRNHRFEIYPDSQRFSQDGHPTEPSVPDPLDDASFLYFLRTIPLEIGKTYTFNRYFRPDRNPVRLTVLRRERVTVPAGTFNTIVVRPIIKTQGIFSQGGQAEVWLSDDSRRMIVQLKTQLTIGALELYLRRYSPGAPTQ